MRVCIPTNGRGGLDDHVSEHFGRARTFTMVDTDSDDVNVIDNTSEHMGGVGKPPEHIARTGAKVLLCSGLGPRAVAMFESYGISVYVGACGTVRETIQMWREGKLEQATMDNACKEHRH
jgi:predicted Fe-Mo cluster-binding NifX family protein